jgi:nitrogen regulatory protein PII
MKRIDAVIRQGSLDEVRERLTNIGVEGLTVTEVIGLVGRGIVRVRGSATVTPPPREGCSKGVPQP